MMTFGRQKRRPSARHRYAVEAAIGLSITVVMVGCGSATGRIHAAVSPSPSLSVSALCIASDLKVSGGWEGATGSMLGSINFTNTGSDTCTLSGYVTVEVINHKGQQLNVQLRQGGPPGDALASGAATSVVVLPPGKTNSADFAVQWFNWCGAFPGTLTLDVLLPDSQKLPVQPELEPWGIARCDQAGSASLLYEAPVAAS